MNTCAKCVGNTVAVDYDGVAWLVWCYDCYDGTTSVIWSLDKAAAVKEWNKKQEEERDQ